MVHLLKFTLARNVFVSKLDFAHKLEFAQLCTYISFVRSAEAKKQVFFGHPWWNHKPQSSESFKNNCHKKKLKTYLPWPIVRKVIFFTHVSINKLWKICLYFVTSLYNLRDIQDKAFLATRNKTRLYHKKA